MDYDIDDILKIITIKCDNDEQSSIEKEIKFYAPDYELNFIIQKQVTYQ